MAAPPAGPEPPFLPLAGLRVVEASHVVMGPACGLFLAALGAEVIKVEPPGGDPTRRLEGMGGSFFTTFNRGKKSVRLDLARPAGRAALSRLLASADVLVENFSAATAARMGIGGPALRRRHPHLVVAACKGFLRGPYQDRTAADEVVQMMTGLAYMTGPSGRPLRAGASITDILGGLFAALGVVAALRERDASGARESPPPPGRDLRIGLFETGLVTVAQHMLAHALGGREAPPMPERDFSWPVYDVFATADGRQLFIGAITDRQWHALCAELDLDVLRHDPGLQSRPDRIRGRDRTLPRFRAAVARERAAELSERLAACGVSCAVVSRPAEMYSDPHASGKLAESRLPDGRVVRGPGLPLEVDGRPLAAGMDLPAPGADSAAVLAALGLDAAEIREAAGDGAEGEEADGDGDGNRRRPGAG